MDAFKQSDSSPTIAFVRQGDLLFVPVGEIPAQAKPEPSGVIARGEATGHHHRLANLEAAEVFMLADWRETTAFVKVGPLGVSISHEEHHTVTLEPSTIYRVNRAREFDYLASVPRIVAD